MKNKIKKYIVSSADWELMIDEQTSRSAAISAIIMAFRKYGKKLLMSTTIMVRSPEDHMVDEVVNADFFATHDILGDLGMNKLSQSFKNLQKIL